MYNEGKSGGKGKDVPNRLLRCARVDRPETPKRGEPLCLRGGQKYRAACANYAARGYDTACIINEISYTSQSLHVPLYLSLYYHQSVAKCWCWKDHGP